MLTFVGATFLNPGGITQRLAAALDGRDKLHLFYNVDVNNQVFYAAKPSDGAWSPALQLQAGAWVGHGYIDLVTSPDSVVHVLFTAGDGKKSLMYDRRNLDQTWQLAGRAFDPVYMAMPGGAALGPFTLGTAALDPSGVVHVAYSVTAYLGPSTLYLATKSGATWQSAPVPIPDARDPFLVIDGSAAMHLVYHPPGMTGVSYATRSAGASAWTMESIDIMGMIRPDEPAAALALASGNVPHALYDTAGGVRHAVRAAGGQWTTDPVSATGRSGSLIISPDGTLHALLLVSGQATYFRRPVGGTWSGTPLGPAVTLGGRRTLAVDSTGLVHAFFMKDTTTKMHAFACVR